MPEFVLLLVPSTVLARGCRWDVQVVRNLQQVRLEGHDSATECTLTGR